jgi:cation diffusion facilitator family transporter
MKKDKVFYDESIINREKVIVRVSLIGILFNVLLSGVKAVIGITANSISVLLDAVNNLSDALSSIITIIGTYLAGKPADKKHPLGYGRIEYLTGMFVAAIVIYAGLTSMVESVKKIFKPEFPDYSYISLVIIVIGVFVKLFLGLYTRKKGKDVNSGSLFASGSDALFDAVLSTSVLIAAIIYIKTGLSIEAYIGALISCFIIKAGCEMMMETLNEILGTRIDKELSKKLKSLIMEEEAVLGVYDLFINNYGPNKDYASVHIELPDTMTVEDVDVITRRIQTRVFTETGIVLTGVGVYSFNTRDDEAADIRNKVFEKVMSHDWALQMHGFYVDIKEKNMRFDVVMSFEINRSEGLKILYSELNEMYEGFTIIISADEDLSD